MSALVLPVIHFASSEQALRNAELASDAGCAGVFLIEMSGRNQPLAAVAQRIKARWPRLLVGLNLLGVDASLAVTANIAAGLDMTWTDSQPTHSALSSSAQADAIRGARTLDSAHQVFVGVAFKHQLEERFPEKAARRAAERGLVPTTSGPATGVATPIEKLRRIREALGAAAPLAVASGVTPENAGQCAALVTHVLVATGVSSSFYELDFESLCRLRAACEA